MATCAKGFLAPQSCLQEMSNSFTIGRRPSTLIKAFGVENNIDTPEWVSSIK